MFFLAGSPLEARQNQSIYSIIIYTVIFAIVLVLIKFIIKIIKGKDLSIKQKANKTTNLSTILKITKIYNLTQEQRDFLIVLCKTHKIPNLEINFHSENFCNNFFMKYYHYFRENKENLSEDEVETKISILFALRQKIENAKKNLSNLASSVAIPEGHKLSYYNDVKEQYECTVLENTKDHLILSIPKNNLNLYSKPKELSKISLFYQSNLGTAFILEVRVIRYQNNTEDGEMVVSHSNHLKCYQRRKYKRIGINNTCNFSAVKTTTVTKENDTVIKYEPLERKHQGKLIELSAGGCSISTKLHIKEKQYIHIELSIDGKTADNVIGLIVNTSENKIDNSYVLHIVFVNINKRTRNKIFSRVYEYIS